jgi:hypothetical protein
VAVDNALPTLKERADLVTRGDHGAGVVELIERLIADDLRDLNPRLRRHAVRLGRRDDGCEEWVDPYGVNVLVAGTSGSGKSTITTGFLERLAEAGYQYAVIDPEGDYANLEGAVVLGDPHRAPTEEEVLALLKSPCQNAVVNLLGLALEHRPAFFQDLLLKLIGLRSRTGRPHWMIVDETHHLLPTAWQPAAQALPQQPRGMLFITVHPASVARAVLESVDLLLAVGEAPDRTIREFCQAIGLTPPQADATPLDQGEVLAWWCRGAARPAKVRTEPPRAERHRHSRKYAEGELGPERSFHFRGPEEKLNLRAQNLVTFLQLADGVDDETWMHHLRRGDYSKWFREGIKDKEIAAEAAAIERREDLSPRESRAAIRDAIERRYTLPAEGSPEASSPKDEKTGD